MIKHMTLACCMILLAAGCSPGEGVDTERTAQLETDQTETAKAIARRWFDEVINERDLDAITDIYAVDYVHHGPEGAEIRGLETARAFAASILAASDDRRAVVEQQVAEGDLVVTRFTSSGRHTGVFRGIEPTGEVWPPRASSSAASRTARSRRTGKSFTSPGYRQRRDVATGLSR